MATLYWGGGTGTWDGFDNSHWYTDVARTTLSARAPSAEDDVVFDSASNATAYTVTIANSTTVCRNVTISGPASGNVTLAGSGIWYVYGDLTLPATGLTRSFTGQLQFWGTASNHTITTNGVTLSSNISFRGSGKYTLQDALNNGGSSIFLGAGTFDTNGKTLTCGSIGVTTTASKTLILGASTISASQSLDFDNTITVNAGTSNITLGTSTGILGQTGFLGATFYNVTFSSATGLLTLNGANTFNNLTFTTPTAARVNTLTLAGNQTVNGTLTIAGQSSVNRYFVRSNLVGTARTLTVASVAALTDVDFRDITVAGTSSPWSGTRLGDCGGNTNITFPAAKTVYWNQVAGGNWYDTAWATSSGGTPDAANFPLAQDTAVINDTGLNTGSTITSGSTQNYNLKTLTSTKTNAFSLSPYLTLYGDLTLTTSITNNQLRATFAGRLTQNLTSAGVTINTLVCSGYNASVKLADNLTVSTLTLTSGGLDTNSKSLTVSSGASVTQVTGTTFSLTLGSSAVSIAGSNGLAATTTNAPTMTVSAGTSTITLTNGNASFGFAGQTLTWYNVTRSAATGSSTTIYGTNTFNNLTFTAPISDRVIPINFAGNQTVNGTLTFGTSATVTTRVGIYSDTLGTQRTITAAAVSGLTHIDFRDIKGAGAANWTTGTRLGDCGGNSGITFPAAKTVYWNLTGTQSWSSTGWATGSGGTPAANNFPLAQDTAVFDDTGAAGTITVEQFNIGTINASGRTSAMTLSFGSAMTVYGDVSYGSGLTISGFAEPTFSGRGTQTYTTAGKTITNGLVIAKPTGTFQHGDAYTATNTITVTAGTYTTQNYNISATTFTSNSGSTRSVSFGSSTVTLSGSLTLASAGLTFTGSSSTINMSSTSGKTFSGADQTFGTVSSTGGTTNPLTIRGSNTFGTLTNSAYTYMIWGAGTTQTITSFTYSGASGSVVRWYTDIPGQRATIRPPSLGAAPLAVGANSTNGGNNSGLTFTGTSPNYFYVKDIAYSVNYNGGPNFFAFF